MFEVSKIVFESFILQGLIQLIKGGSKTTVLLQIHPEKHCIISHGLANQHIIMISEDHVTLM